MNPKEKPQWPRLVTNEGEVVQGAEAIADKDYFKDELHPEGEVKKFDPKAYDKGYVEKDPWGEE